MQCHRRRKLKRLLFGISFVAIIVTLYLLWSAQPIPYRATHPWLVFTELKYWLWEETSDLQGQMPRGMPVKGSQDTFDYTGKGLERKSRAQYFGFDIVYSDDVQGKKCSQLSPKTRVFVITNKRTSKVYEVLYEDLVR